MVAADQMQEAFSQVRHTQQPLYDRVEFEEFISALKEIIFAEREVESAKIELALKSDFNIIDSFRMMDVRGSNYLT